MKQKKGGVGLCNAEKDLPKGNSRVVFLMHCEPAEWSVPTNFRYILIIFSLFEKITPRY